MSSLASKNIRPSNLHRRERCPASLRMEQALPEPVMASDAPASRGNRLHEAISAGLRDPGSRVELLGASDDPEMLQTCWNEAEGLWNGIPESVRSRARVLVEKIVDLSALDMDKGTLDFAIIAPPTQAESGVVILRDWKTGMGYVPAARYNLQLMAYAYGMVYGSDLSPDCAVDIGIFQPAVRPVADSYKTTVGDILTLTDRIKGIVARCEATGAPAIPGGWCNYCRASDSCQTRLSVAVEVRQIADPVEAVRSLTGSARREMYENLGKAVKILEKAQETIDTAILSGVLTVEGYEVGEGRKTRAWSNEAEAIEELTARSIRDGSGASVVQPVSVATAEKMFGKGEFDHLTMFKIGNPVVKRSKK